MSSSQGVIEIAKLVREKKVTASEMLEQCVDRIRTGDSDTQAFMRIDQETVKGYVGGGADPVEVMRKLRNKKDHFAGSSRPWIPGGGPLPGL